MSTTVPLKGRLTADPQLRFTAGGTPVSSFTVVMSRRGKNPAGEWEDKNTSFYDCNAFGPIAENICNHLQKGMAVVGLGEMHQESYTAKDGEKKTVWRVNVDALGEDLRWKKDEHQGSRQPATSYEDEPPF
jgi:single-strand DNA-binding protein